MSDFEWGINVSDDAESPEIIPLPADFAPVPLASDQENAQDSQDFPA